jgi:16S rRNA processing protein RimM
MPRSRSRILIGRIGPAHGIRGEVMLHSYASRPADIAGYGPLTDEAATRMFDITSLRKAGKGLIARLDGVEDRTSAEALSGTGLYVARERLPPTGENEWYIADLVGLNAVTSGGTTIGSIVAVPNYGAGNLLEIAPTAGGETLLIPFADLFVADVDPARGCVVVEMPAETADDVGEPEPQL